MKELFISIILIVNFICIGCTNKSNSEIVKKSLNNEMDNPSKDILTMESSEDSKYFKRIIELYTPRMNGEDVLMLQNHLLSLGFYELGEADSYYGPLTEAVIINIQTFSDFYPDGKVDKILWNYIFNPKNTIVLKEISKPLNYIMEKPVYTEEKREFSSYGSTEYEVNIRLEFPNGLIINNQYYYNSRSPDGSPEVDGGPIMYIHSSDLKIYEMTSRKSAFSVVKGGPDWNNGHQWVLCRIPDYEDWLYAIYCCNLSHLTGSSIEIIEEDIVKHGYVYLYDLLKFQDVIENLAIMSKYENINVERHGPLLLINYNGKAIEIWDDTKKWGAGYTFVNYDEKNNEIILFCYSIYSPASSWQGDKVFNLELEKFVSDDITFNE